MLKSQPKRIIKLIAAAAACATLLPFGQIRGETESAEAMPEPKVEVGEEQIEKAVSASFKIAGIQEQIQEDLQGIEDQDVIQARIQEAEAEMIKILSELGLDREQYIGIMQAVEQDQALLAAFIQEMQRQQPPEEQADPPKPPLDPGQISDRQLEQAAEIYVAVQAIGKALQEELRDEDDQATIQTRIAQAEEEILKAVEKSGMEAQEYEDIMRTLQHDQELLERFIKLVE